MRTNPVREASALGRTAWNAYAYNISYRTGKSQPLNPYSLLWPIVAHASTLLCRATAVSEVTVLSGGPPG